MGASKTTTFLGSRYRRIVKRRGKKRALVAVGNSILTIAYCLLSDPDTRFVDLGTDFHDRLHPQRRTRQLIRELEHVSGKQGPSTTPPDHWQAPSAPSTATSPAPLRSAGRYRLPTHRPIFDSAGACPKARWGRWPL
jgi:hypothetical protein